MEASGAFAPGLADSIQALGASDLVSSASIPAFGPFFGGRRFFFHRGFFRNGVWINGRRGRFSRRGSVRDQPSGRRTPKGIVRAIASRNGAAGLPERRRVFGDALGSWRLYVQFNVKKTSILERALVAPVPVN
jgi:hypothetical protein